MAITMNVTNYLSFKNKRYTDRVIAQYFDVTPWELSKFKQRHDLVGIQPPGRMETKVDKRKKHYLELYGKGWSHNAIAKGLRMSPAALTLFKHAHFPDHVRKPAYRFTHEEKQRIKKAGMTWTQVRDRMRLKGMTFEEALASPPRKPKVHLTKAQTAAIKEAGMNRGTVYSRIAKGMSFEEAIKKRPRPKKQRGGTII